MSPAEWGTPLDEGTNYTVDLVECSPGQVWRFGGMPVSAAARREFLNAVLQAARAAMSELDEHGVPDLGVNHPWHPHHRQR